ncbi:MAG: MarR family winged helix-turn-helix transcriptional regulator, partial [Chloroflexi bacterium]|nr:MarR family winged helix-turn-helix transcriptional regulator [Chloroflexota bacterium]
DVLVTRGLVMREVLSGDRRRVSLRLSDIGISELKEARRITESHLADALSALSPVKQTGIVEALQALLAVFAPEKSHTAGGGRG